MWWNIQYGETNKKTSDRPLDQNLIELIHSEAKPDILLLGEFTQEALAPSTLEQLHERNPYYQFIPYNRNCLREGLELGFGIFSKMPLRLLHRSQVGWRPVMANRDRLDFFTGAWPNTQHTVCYERPFIDFEFQDHLGKPVRVAPIHLAQPWYEMIGASPNKTWAKFEVAFQIFFGGNNPLYYQLQRIASRLHTLESAGREKVPADENNDIRQILIGDFNIPLTYGPIKSTGNLLLENTGYRSIMKSEETTFPATSSDFSGKIRPLKIDQVFGNSNTRLSKDSVLPLRGSDHYPIFIILAE